MYLSKGSGKRIWLLFSLLVAALAVGLGASSSGAFAGALLSPLPGLPVGAGADTGKAGTGTTLLNDGFDSLPAGLRAMSYSTLVNTGKVHPSTSSSVPAGDPPPVPKPDNPQVTISWGSAVNISGSPGGTYGANEPAAAMHPSNNQRAMSGGNTYAPSPIHTNIENTLNQGASWARSQAVNCSSSGDGVPVWLSSNFFGGLGALNTSLCPSADGLDMAQSRTTDGGNTWTVLSNNLLGDGFENDREYLWTDYNPSSPFFGRTYMSEANFDPGGTGSYLSISVRATTDGGASWTPNNALVASNEFALGTNHNEYPSLAILPNGHVVAAWHRGMCCGGPSPINTNNKVMWARSTDGGVTFPISGTIVSVPLNNSVPFNATSPGGFRWSDTPNIGADPTNGYLYATWIQYRTASTPGSSAAYVSRSTDEGNTWSAPVIADNSNIAQFQYMPWIEASTDHTVHLTYSKQIGTTTQLAHFYVQSTDNGATWSTPFQLSGTIVPTGFMGDYQALDIGGYASGQAVIFTTWTQAAGTGATEDRFGRFGSFTVATPTNTPTNTPTITPTPPPCGPGSNYAIATATATIVPGVTDTGNHTDDGLTTVALPFAYNLYGQSFSSIQVSSNGQLDFLTGDSGFSNVCLPDTTASFAIFPYWDDQRTDAQSGCSAFTGGLCGIFTSVSGTAPNRIFNVEWRTVYFANVAQTANYEVRLYEGQSRFDVVYGTVTNGNTSATVGVQRDTGSLFTQYACNGSGGGITANLLLTFAQPPCDTPTFTSTPTVTNTPTITPTGTPTCAVPPGPWIASSAYPSTIVRYGFAQVGNSFYVLGGVSNGTVVGTVNRYDVGTGTWTSLAPAPTLPGEAPAAAYYNGKIYLAPGSGVTAFQIYDIPSNTWSSGAPYPGTGYGEAAGAYNGNVYVVGGSGTVSNNTWIYNIATNTWSAGTSAPTAFLLAGYQQVGQYLYIVGGFGTAPSQPNGSTNKSNTRGMPAGSVLTKGNNPQAPAANNSETMRLDMSSGTWSNGPAWTPGRADFGLAYLGGKLYALGGDTTGGGYFDSSAEVDELDAGAWPAGTWVHSAPDLPSIRQANQAGFSGSNTIWSTGGLDGTTFTFLSDHLHRTQGGGLKILLVGADCGTPPNTLANQLRALADVRQVDIFDAFAGTPSLALMEQYDVVVPFSNCGYADQTTLGNNLADYEDAHGAVVAFNFDWYGSTQSIAGRWLSGGFSPFLNNAAVNFATSNLATCTFAPVCSGVNSLSNFYRETATVSVGATLVGTWGDSTAAIVYTGRTLGVSGYVGDGSGGWSGDYARLIANWGDYINPPGNSWHVVANYASTIESAAVASDGTYVYSAGGYSGGAATSAFYRYDPAANTWTALASLPTALYANRAVYAANTNSIYVFGGYDGSTVLNTTYRYNIGTGTWSTGAPMPAGHYFPNDAYDAANGKIYVIGGFNTSFSEDTETYEYDPVANTWNTTRASIPVAMGGSGTSISGQFIYLVGSWSGGTGSTTHYRYDIVNNAWTAMAPAPAPIYEPGAGNIGPSNYIFGGGNPSLGKAGTNKPLSTRGEGPTLSPDTSYTSSYIYDIASNTWSAGPSLNVAHSFTGGTSFGSHLIVVGGFNGSGDTNTVEMFTAVFCTPPPPTPTPTVTPSPTATVCGIGSWAVRTHVPYNARGIFAVSNGTYVYAGGGYDGTNIHSDLLRYDPVADTWTPLASSPDQHFLGPAVYDATTNKIYNPGGFDGTGAVTSTNRIYNVAANTWTTGAPMPTALSDHAVMLFNGVVYVAGGYNGSAAVSTLYAYSIAGNSWTTLAPLPQALYLPAFGAINGKLYVAGGNTGSVELNTLYIYDIASNTWSSGPNLTFAVTAPGSAVVAGKLWVFGGGFPTTRTDTQIYDPVSNAWSSGPNLNVARLWFYGTYVSSQNAVVALGGDSTPGIPVNTNEVDVASPCSTPTFTPTNTPTNTPTRTPTNTPTRTNTPTNTPTPGNILIGHVTISGITQPNVRNVEAITLTLCVSGSPVTYTNTLDSSGFFTVTTGLPNGTYGWKVKPYKSLSNSGTLTLAGGTLQQEMGTLKGGDANNSNNVNATDFNLLKNAFGTSNNLNTDFNNDGITNTTDFNLLKNSFGQSGTGTCP